MLKDRIHLRRVRRLIGLVCKLSSGNEDSINPLTPVYQRTNYPILFPYLSYKSTGEKLLKYQENSPWVMISLILMTSGVE